MYKYCEFSLSCSFRHINKNKWRKKILSTFFSFRALVCFSAPCVSVAIEFYIIVLQSPAWNRNLNSGWLNWRGREEMSPLCHCVDAMTATTMTTTIDGRRSTTTTTVSMAVCKLSLYRIFKCNAILLIFDAVYAYAFIHFFLFSNFYSFCIVIFRW